MLGAKGEATNDSRGEVRLNKPSAKFSRAGDAGGRDLHAPEEALSIDQTLSATRNPLIGITWALAIEGGIALGGYLLWCAARAYW